MGEHQDGRHPQRSANTRHSFHPDRLHSSKVMTTTESQHRLAHSRNIIGTHWCQSFDTSSPVACPTHACPTDARWSPHCALGSSCHFHHFTVNEVLNIYQLICIPWIVNNARGSRTAALDASGCGVTSVPDTTFGEKAARN